MLSVAIPPMAFVYVSAILPSWVKLGDFMYETGEE